MSRNDASSQAGCTARIVVQALLVAGLVSCSDAVDVGAAAPSLVGTNVDEDAGDATDSSAAEAGTTDAAVGGDAGGGTSFVDICGVRVDPTDYAARGSELIVDVATHAIAVQSVFGCSPSPGEGWLERRLDWMERPPGCAGASCYDREAYEGNVFITGDTRFAVLAGIPYSVGADGTGVGDFTIASNESLFEMQAWLNRSSRRVFVAPAVMPNDRLELQLAAMARWAPAAFAWYVATAWWPGGGGGFWLDDAEGRAVIERGIALGRPIFMVPKGMPRHSFSQTHTDPRDVGAVAAAYPEGRFIVLQSAFEHGLAAGETSRPASDDPDSDGGSDPGPGMWPEGPYDEDDADVRASYPLDRGVNSLIKSLRDHGIGPNQNVYASLDAVWAELIDRPTEAAHVLGKLLRHVGEDNVLWGTQSVFYGSAAPQIEAFRAFEIPAEFRERYGYVELTPERKAKILGLNAARLLCAYN